MPFPSIAGTPSPIVASWGLDIAHDGAAKPTSFREERL